MSPSSRGRGLKCSCTQERCYEVLVALFTRAWIEINPRFAVYLLAYVALFTRAWIEIHLRYVYLLSYQVALFTRAWIEMDGLLYTLRVLFVALFTRAWIEILPVIWVKVAFWSPSSRGRGLK